MKHPLAGLAFLAVCSALVVPPIVVGLSVLNVPLPAALLLVATLLGIAAWRWWSDVTRLAMPLTERPVWVVLWLLVGLAAGVQNVRLGRFMLDASRADDSVIPWQPFFRQHSCLTAYTEAARLLPSGVNVYDPELYKDSLSTSPSRARRIGPFEVDGFEYPPPFLLLPRSFVAAGVDFFTIRSGWFALQELLLLGTMAWLASWIGGQSGHSAGLLIPLLLAAPSTLLSLQIGNFQLTAISLGIIALLAFDRERPMLGGFAFGFAALAKIYPGVLGLFLLGPGRRRARLCTLAGSVALVLTALATFG